MKKITSFLKVIFLCSLIIAIIFTVYYKSSYPSGILSYNEGDAAVYFILFTVLIYSYLATFISLCLLLSSLFIRLILNLTKNSQYSWLIGGLVLVVPHTLVSLIMYIIYIAKPPDAFIAGIIFLLINIPGGFLKSLGLYSSYYPESTLEIFLTYLVSTIFYALFGLMVAWIYRKIKISLRNRKMVKI